jgi:hypothetical protein
MSHNSASNWCVVHERPARICAPLSGTVDPWRCTFVVVNDWIDDCLKNHSECTKAYAGGKWSSILPTRLIDVGSIDPPRPPHLVKSEALLQSQETGNDGHRAGYACLSYCWGPPDKANRDCLLLESNETLLMQAIPYASLPRTIREAIDVCRRTNIRYLWIDALCIIQSLNGDSHDWQIESARVGAYYHNAFLIIAATSSAINTEGCLPHNLRTGVQRLGTLLYDSITGPSLREHHIFNDEITQSPLLRRGWVLQQIALSRRILWLTTSGAYWECKTAMKADREARKDCTSMHKPLQLEEPIGKLSATSFHDQWISIVERYSTMSLANRSDVLPALSGVCKFLDPHQHDKYLAGIWKSELIRGLSWHISTEKCQIIGAPSWSWISAGSGISFDSASVNIFDLNCSCNCPDPKLIFHDVQQSGADIHGQISHASLCLRMPIHDLLFEDSGSKPKGFPYFDGRIGKNMNGLVWLDEYTDKLSFSTRAALLAHRCPDSENRALSAAILLLDEIPEEGVYKRKGYARIYAGDDNFQLHSIFGSESMRDIILV